ncbi:MAG: TolC family protein [Bacteroidales bacterium]|nr:TolC family protein [Bacteroidales bacterium]
MKMIFSFCVVAILYFAGIGSKCFAQNNASKVLTLSDCFEYAFENSYDLRKAVLDRLESEAAHSENKAALFPQIIGSATLTNNIKLASILMPGEFFGYDGDIAIEMGAKYNSYAGLNLEQVIFDANLFTGIKNSRNARELTRLKEQMTKEELIYNIGNAYYDIIYSQNLLESNLQTLVIMDSIYAKTELQVAQNITREIDLNRMKVGISNMKVDIHKSLATIVQQKNYLKVLIGMPIAYDFMVSDQIEAPTTERIFIEDTDIRNQIDLQILDREQTAASLEVRQIKNSYIPTLSLRASSSYNFEAQKFQLSNSQFWSNGTFVQLTLSVPIFDGGQKLHRIRQTQYRFQRVQEDIKQTEQNILGDRESYRALLLTGYNSVQAQHENLDIAEKTYQQGIMLYEEGLYSITDLLDTEKSFREAQTAYTYELVNYQKTMLDLMKAEGTLETLVNNNKK